MSFLTLRLCKNMKRLLTNSPPTGKTLIPFIVTHRKQILCHCTRLHADHVNTNKVITPQPILP